MNADSFHSTSATAHESETLQRDLSLVLPAIERIVNPTIRAYRRGEPIEMDEAIAQTSEIIGDAQAPAIVGVSGLTIEATRHAVALAERARMRLLPGVANDEVLSRAAVMHSATLGHAMACDAVVLVGDVSPASTIVNRVRERVDHVLEVTPSLETIRTAQLALTNGDHENELAKLLRDHRRVAALLAPDCSALAVEGWHALAGSVQQQSRLAVITLPALRTFGNLRGAMEVVTWQTGLSCATGGIDFADGGPRSCGPLPKLLARGALDVVIDTGLTPSAARSPVKRIAFTRGVDPTAEVCFVGPGLCLGLAARVMRFDGVVLWLCEPSMRDKASRDPVASILERITAAAG